MKHFHIRISLAAVTAMALFASPVAAQILIGGQPNPAFNGNAMQVWLRADSGVTTAGGAVSDWQDRSNNNNDATQATGTDQPVHATGSFLGRDVINFDGNGDHFKFGTGFDSTFDGSFTMFAVLAPNDGDPNKDNTIFGLVSGDGQDRMVLGLDGNDDSLNHLYKVEGNSANTFIDPLPWPDGPQTGFTLVSYANNSGGNNESSAIFIDGTPTGVSTGSDTSAPASVTNTNFNSDGNIAYLGAAQDSGGGFFPGSDRTLAGGIAEFIIYDGALSLADRQAVEGYLLSYVPEPASCVLLALGFLGLLAQQRRRG